MNAFMTRYMRVVDGMNVAIRWVLAAILMLMTVLIGWQVVARFVVGDPLTFSEEVSRFLMVWLVIVGSAYAAKNGRLMKVDILEHMLSGRARKTAITVAGLVSIVFYLVLVVFGFMIVNAVSYQLTPATEVSMSIPMAALPVGGVLLVMNTVYQLFATAKDIDQESEVEEILAEADVDPDEASAVISDALKTDDDTTDGDEGSARRNGGDQS
ncbi:MAG: TRAP transporter small permease [Brevibacterium yomogidense]|uniref:TRAP transporter small permease n=1 Tax=Brevibacterium sp. Mu109 TaxID=1255669 RepID=UPI000C3E3029|nr:TRAP transporter small permease [Brevibacterium sp. Mu109]SMX89621.1 TRAP-type C4-dicarboxylate transport system, small permease component [Brevibacterium sp. Mu109]